MEQGDDHELQRVWQMVHGHQSRRCIHSAHKKLIYEIIHRGVSRHSMRDLFFLLKILPAARVIDPYVIFRYIMILMNSTDSRYIDNNFILYLETMLSKFDFSKLDIFVEFMAYLLKNNRIDDARELYNSRHKYMSYQTHRKVLYSSINISCYSLILNYLSWQKLAPSQENPTFDVSIQGWLVNTMESLKQVQHNYEFYIMCMTNVLLFYGFHTKVYLLLSEFQRTNPDNLAAQLLLLKHINKMTGVFSDMRRRHVSQSSDQMDVDDSEEDNEEAREQHRSIELSAINNFKTDKDSEPFDIERFPIRSDNITILANLTRLDSSRDELLELSKVYHCRLEVVKVLMDSLMEVRLMRDISRWRYLSELIEEITSSNQPNEIEGLRLLWQTRYQRYWRLRDILRLARASASHPMRASHSNVIKRVIKSLRTNFDLVIPQEFGCERTEAEAGFDF